MRPAHGAHPAAVAHVHATLGRLLFFALVAQLEWVYSALRVLQFEWALDETHAASGKRLIGMYMQAGSRGLVALTSGVMFP